MELSPRTTGLAAPPDRHDVRAGTQHRRLCFERPQEVEQAMTVVGIGPLLVEIQEQPANAFDCQRRFVA